MVSIVEIGLYTKPVDEHVTPYTLNELYQSALPWECEVYVLPTRRLNCVVTN